MTLLIISKTVDDKILEITQKNGTVLKIFLQYEY